MLSVFMELITLHLYILLLLDITGVVAEITHRTFTFVANWIYNELFWNERFPFLIHY